LTFEKLIDFLENKMSMSHIYQPLLIRSLVDAGGTATLRQLAQAFVAQDESQLRFYEKRIKEMPLKVLTRHGVVEHREGLVALATKPLTLEQKAHVKRVCEQRLQQFVQKRGLALWDYRLLETDPIPDSLRFQVLKGSGGRCALCGATKRDRPLDVDHIIPRNRGGKHEPANLQVLCAKCNRSKRDQDMTDFRVESEALTTRDCVFCSRETAAKAVGENGSVFAIKDRHPVTQGHLLVIPRRHTPDYFSMTAGERGDAEDLLRVLRNKALQLDGSVEGFNIGANCGEAAGQTVAHAHIHFIPRRRGDTPSPKGGIRGAIPEKMAY
jgi:diadenosine tetraphosphate (Ap4A) HIT family hydrolase